MRTYTSLTRSLVISLLLIASMFVVTLTVSALEIGEEAPKFTLSSTMGGTISLNQYKGKKLVLIQFYSTDFNPT